MIRIRRLLLRKRTLGLLALLALIALIIAWRIPDDQTQHTTLRDALKEYRSTTPADDSSRRPAPSVFPPPGVYRYRTTGGERIAISLLTASHDYTGVSSLTIEPKGCGIRERWQVLTTRWLENVFCDAHRRIRMDLTSEHRAFYGQATASTFRCSGPSVPAYSMAARGTSWRTPCRGKGGSAVSHSTIRKLGRQSVDGRVVRAMLIETRVSLRGDTTGTVTEDDWRRASDGLLLRRRAHTHTSISTPVGGGTYREDYELTLLSQKPRS